MRYVADGGTRGKRYATKGAARLEDSVCLLQIVFTIIAPRLLELCEFELYPFVAQNAYKSATRKYAMEQ